MSCLSCYIMFSDPKVIRRLSEGYPKLSKDCPVLAQVWRPIAVAFGNPLPACEEEAGDETRRDDETTRRRDETRFDSFVRLCWALLGFVAHGSKPQFQLNFNSIGKKLINS